MRSGRSTLLLTIVFVLLSGAIFFYFVQPKSTDVRDARKTAALARAQLDQEQQVAEGFKELKSAVDKNANAIAKLDAALPQYQDKPTDVPELLTLFQDIAEKKAGGLIIQQLQVSDPTTAPQEIAQGKAARGNIKKASDVILSRDISLHGVASYDGLKRFVEGVAISLRLAEPVQLSFTSSGDVSQSLVNFSATFRVFLYQP